LDLGKQELVVALSRLLFLFDISLSEQVDFSKDVHCSKKIGVGEWQCTLGVALLCELYRFIDDSPAVSLDESGGSVNDFNPYLELLCNLSWLHAILKVHLCNLRFL
jgi:hypothetical protein